MAEKLKVNPTSGNLDLIDVYDDTTVVKQGGNSFGTTMTIGTDDNNPVNIETNGSTKLTVATNGETAIVHNSTTNESLTLTNQNTTANTTTRIRMITNGTGTNSNLILSSASGGGTASYFRGTDVQSGSVQIFNLQNGVHTLGSNGTSNVINLSNTSFPSAQVGVSSTRKFYITDGTAVRLFVRNTNQVATDTSNYETLITNNNDFVNKKYVDNLVTITSATYTALESDTIIEVNSTSNAVQITLPSSITNGKKFYISWVAGANPVTITSPINLIDPADNTAKTTVSILNLNDTLTYFRGSLRYQLF